MTDVHTLRDIAQRTQWLDFECNHCRYRGRYRVSSLIARSGVALPSPRERCGINFPTLLRLF